MLKPIKKAIKERLENLRVRNKRPTIFDRTTEGERYARHYPSVSYDIYIDELNKQDYMYAYYQPDSVAEVSGLGTVGTRSFGNTGYTKTGYDTVTIIKARPYNVAVELVTRAKTDNDDIELTEGILNELGHYGQVTITSSDAQRTHGFDLELLDQVDMTKLYRRLEDTQRLYERRYAYNVEGWLEAPHITTSTVQSRFFEEYQYSAQVSTTGYFTVSSSFIGTYSPDGS
jgi:hypothetical protein